MIGVKWKAQGLAFLVGGGHAAVHWIIATIYVSLPFIQENLGLSYTEAGSIISIFHAASFAANIGSGAVVDITGHRVLIQVASLLVGGTALILVGFADGVWLLAALVVFVGSTNNLWHPAAIAYLSHAYPESRGYALSIHTLGASVGDTISPLVAGTLLLWLPWQGAASVNALPVFAVALALFVVLPLIIPTRILDEANVIVALTLYTTALLVRAVPEALDAVPAAVRDAATAVGYRPLTRMLKIELPLAIPVLIAGLRVVAVTNISMVAVGSVIGIGGLGTWFTEGYQSNKSDQIVAGIIAIFVLAIVIDTLIMLAGKALTPWTRADRSTGKPKAQEVAA